MSPRAKATPQDAPHPSPHRASTGLAKLLYGLMAAPAAWATSQIVNPALAQEACFPRTERLANPAFGGLHVLQGAIILVTLAVCVSAAAVAFGAWRATRNEHPGDEHALLSVGEGRSRFMAFAGVLTSLGFLTAGLFWIPALMFVPAC